MSRAAVVLAVAIAASGIVAPARAETQHIRAGQLHIAFTVVTARVTNIQSFLARVIIRNRGKQTVRIDTRSLDAAQFALEFRDAGGARVPHCPPPMPTERRPIDEIEPGHRIGYDYRAEICIPLARGEYQVRFAYGNDDANDGAWVGSFASDWARFELR